MKKILYLILGMSLLLAGCKPSSVTQEANTESDLSSIITEDTDIVTEDTIAAETITDKAASSKNFTKPEIITIVHVNDIHGYVDMSDSEIGYPAISAYIDKVKEANPNTLALDAGDTFAGAPEASFDKGESIVSILNTLDFDAMTLGNNDMYLGEERLTELLSEVSYPVLAGNVVASTGTIWEDYTIITLENGLKAGIVSATTTAPEGAQYLDVVETTQKLVDEVTPQADIVIALIHLGVEDSSGNTSQKIAEEVTGIDVIIDGHSHTALEEGLVVNGTLIAQAGEYGQYIGVTELVIENKEVTSATSRLVTRAEINESDEKNTTKQAVQELLKKSEIYYAQEVGETTVDLVGTRELIRTGETNLGSFYADAVRDTLGTEIALCAAGNIGGEIPAGKITKKEILAISRVEVTFSTVELSGSDLKSKLNQLVNEYPEPSGAFAQVSGLSYEFDPSLEIGNRIVQIMVNGEPLDDSRIYKAAFTTKLLGDLAEQLEISEYPDSSNVIIEEYIRKNSPINPVIEGRITITESP